MHPDIEAILVDPESKRPLRRATEDELARLREQIATARARRRDGSAIGDFDGAFISEDRKVAYLIEGGQPNFLIDERIEIAP